MLIKPNIIDDFFENIVLFNTDFSIIYFGCTLRKLLEVHSIHLDKKTKIFGKYEKNFENLNNAFESVVARGDEQTFKFEKTDSEFILLSHGYENYRVVIFGLKDKISEITKIELELKEVINSLRCLYSVSKELEAPKPFGIILENCIQHVQDGFRYSKDVIINIKFKNKIYGSPDFDATKATDLLTLELKSAGARKGEIRVYTTDKRGLTIDERNLIDEFAGKISRAIEKEEKQNNLEKQQVILKAKNDALMKVTGECNKSREKLKTFFKAITDKIVVIDSNFNIIMSNKDDIGEGGKCYDKLFNSDSICDDCPAADTFETSNDEYREREYDEKYLTLRTYPIFDKDWQVDRVLEVCRDKTNEKKMESQLLQSYKLASLGKLVAGVAHEINNPNTFILGNLKIVQEALNDIMPILDDYSSNNPSFKIARLNYPLFKENIAILIDDMISGANRTKKIVNDLRNFAKKDDDGLTDDLDLNYIITNNLTLTEKHIKKNATLEFDLADNLPIIKGNIQRIEQVLHNLILNASEAIERSDGVIKISTAYDEKSSQIVLKIIDNGSGMDDFTRKNIFDPFFTTKRNKGGTGLGLSISYGIIKDHSGAIDVESKVGQGTKFTIKFPVK